MTRFRFTSFLAILLILSAGLESQASVFSPEFQSVLQSLKDQDQVSVIVTLSEKADIRPFKGQHKSLLRSNVIKAFRNKADLTQAPIKTFLESRMAKRIEPLWLINGMAVTATVEVVRQLASLPGVEQIKPDSTITVPVITYAGSTLPEWNINAIHAPDIWNLGYKGAGVVVANMDTGVDVNHPDLMPKWRGGANSWFDPHGVHATPFDAIGHGTQSMGIMVGGNAGGTTIGVAPDAKWIAVKIYDDSGQTTLSAIHQGFQWLLDPDGNPNTDDAPDVVNNSWGLGNTNGCSQEFQPDIDALKAAGIAVVFAGGNSGPNLSTSISPANNPGGFAVGSIDQSLSLDTFSSRGPSACDGAIYPDLVAPGVAIKTSDLSFGGFPYYAIIAGTSAAAPHVAGTMALLFNAFPGLTVPELESALTQSAFDLGLFGPDNDYGYGLVDVQEAYSLLLNPRPRITADPLSYDFGQVQRGKISSPEIFNVMNKGIRNLVVGSVSMTGTNASEFTKSVDTCSMQTLPPSAACTVQAVFSPQSTGARTASLTIPSNDTDTPTLNLSLIGTGILIAPQAATLVSPSGAIATSTPTYTWNAVTNADEYYLWVNDSSGNRIQQWFTAAAVGCGSGTGICSVTPATVLATGSATWWIQTRNAVGTGPWSLPMYFTVGGGTSGPPGAATLVSPSGPIATNSPTYSWNAVVGSTWYNLYVNDPYGNRIAKWYTATDVGCPSGTGSCSIAPTTVLGGGACQWWIQTWNSYGTGPWSTAMAFTTPAPPSPPPTPILVSPTGTIATTSPTYTWNALATATDYFLWVNDSGGNKIQQWFTAAASGCGSGTGICSVTPATVLNSGAGQWWVQAKNGGGTGPWSAPMSFTINGGGGPSGPPGAATLVSPSGAAGINTPTYTWNAVNGSTWYYLWVNDSTGTKITTWYTATQVACSAGTGTCSITPATVLASGAGKWWIQTWNSFGAGPWSAPMAFIAP